MTAAEYGSRLWEDRPTIVLLEVTAADAPYAEVMHTVPVEARVRSDAPRELLLWVKKGKLESIELVDYTGTEPGELPEPEDIEAPTTNSAGEPPPELPSGR